ncbi:MAG: GntR family transcriptional regulator [Ideonella sp.]|nr:GntR family transcriptional regulator [Ideonella sp.]
MAKTSLISTQSPASSADGRRDLGVRSLTTAVYGRLRADIISNRLKQGEKLHLANLQQQYGVSLSVVREALSRLVADGLVVAEEQRGFKVSPISKSDLVDVTRMRIALECMAIEMAMTNGDDAWRATLQRTYDRLRTLVRAKALDQWGEAHADFHRSLVSACDSPWLMRFRETLFEQSQRYRSVSIDRSRLPLAAIDREHREILKAVLAGEIQAAKAAITSHFAGTLERALATTELK